MFMSGQEYYNEAYKRGCAEQFRIDMFCIIKTLKELDIDDNRIKVLIIKHHGLTNQEADNIIKNFILSSEDVDIFLKNLTI